MPPLDIISIPVWTIKLQTPLMLFSPEIFNKQSRNPSLVSLFTKKLLTDLSFQRDKHHNFHRVLEKSHNRVDAS